MNSLLGRLFELIVGWFLLCRGVKYLDCDLPTFRWAFRLKFRLNWNVLYSRRLFRLLCNYVLDCQRGLASFWDFGLVQYGWRSSLRLLERLGFALAFPIIDREGRSSWGLWGSFELPGI